MNKTASDRLLVPLLLALSMVLILDKVLAYSRDNFREAEVISEVRTKILSYYVDDVPSQKILKGALQGMLETLDPYSEYLDEENYRQMSEGTEGEFVGIGIEINQEHGNLTVASPIEGSPAAKAGVLAGDKIIAIDGKLTEGMSLSDCIQRLRGRQGTPVVVKVLRLTGKSPEDITIIRDKIQITSIKDPCILERETGIGYLRLSKFNRHTGEDLRKNIDKLLQDGMRSLIIDLRFNSGGLLEASVDVVDCFVTEGVIVETKGRDRQSHKVYRAEAKDTYDKLPLVVLVNKRSASASEIVAGALQDHRRARLVGSKTYGKGSVQSILPLSDEKTAIKLTTAKYYTPAGRCIEKQGDKEGGIDPDIAVEMSPDEERELVRWFASPIQQRPTIHEHDRQLQKAVEILKKK